MTEKEIMAATAALTAACDQMTKAINDFARSADGLADSVNDLTVLVGDALDDDDELPLMDVHRHDVEGKGGN